MTNLSWRARFERQASEKATDRVPSGSSALLNLRLDAEADHVDSIAAIEALVRRHLPLLKSKRAIEAVLTEGRNHLHVPKVEDPVALERELRRTGLAAKVAMMPGRVIDVRALRKRLSVSQEQFAARYRISLDVLRNWEQHRNEPDPIARTVLEMIDRDPLAAETALWGG